MGLYMGLIVLYRAHPSMPPVANMAVGLMAKDTWEYAAEVGRIAAGLSEDVSQAASIGTVVAAAFIESCFCLFVAGIQVRSVGVTPTPNPCFTGISLNLQCSTATPHSATGS